MDKKKRCEMTKDLLPLYADEICGEASREFVEEHLRECGDCRQELADYRYNTGLPEQGEEKEVFTSFSKKMKKRNLVKVILSVVLCLAVIASAAYVLFVPEYVVSYSEGLMEAKIPVDEGVDVYVNLDNYKMVHSYDLRDDEGYTDIYLTVMETNFTRLFKDRDKSDNFWRIGNSNQLGWCAQSGVTRPISGEKPVVRNIYYLVMHPDEVLYMTDEISFEDYDKHLIWNNPELKDK